MSVPPPDDRQVASSRRLVRGVTRDGWTLVSTSMTWTFAPSIRASMTAIVFATSYAMPSGEPPDVTRDHCVIDPEESTATRSRLPDGSTAPNDSSYPASSASTTGPTGCHVCAGFLGSGWLTPE